MEAQVKVETDGLTMTFSAMNDRSAFQTELSMEGPTIVEPLFKMGEMGDAPCRSGYSVDYLLTFLKAFKHYDWVTFAFAGRRPCRLDVKLNDQGGLVSFYLAPRITDDAVKASG